MHKLSFLKYPRNQSHFQLWALVYIRFLLNSAHYKFKWNLRPSSSPYSTLVLSSDIEESILIAKFRLKLKKVGKTTRPFRYDLSQIPYYDYTVEITNRFKGLDLIECLKNYWWRFVTLYRRQGSRPSPRKRKAKRQNGCLRRPYKWLWIEEKPKEKEIRKDIPIWMQSSKE